MRVLLACAVLGFAHASANAQLAPQPALAFFVEVLGR